METHFFCFSSDHLPHFFYLANPLLMPDFVLKCQSSCWRLLMLITERRPRPMAQDGWGKYRKKPVNPVINHTLPKTFPHISAEFQNQVLFYFSSLIIYVQWPPSPPQGRPLKQQVKICMMVLVVLIPAASQLMHRNTSFFYRFHFPWEHLIVSSHCTDNISPTGKYWICDYTPYPHVVLWLEYKWINIFSVFCALWAFMSYLSHLLAFILKKTTSNILFSLSEE